MALSGGTRVRTWGRTTSSVPAQVVRARSVDDVVASVRKARELGLRVKAIGAGHSFTAVAMTDGLLLDVSGLAGVLGVSGHRVRLGAGTHLHQLPALLAPHGLALENMGDIDRQTVAGATSTGTHGTGLGFGGLATRITAATLVTAAGEVLEVAEGDPLLPAVRLGLGALGVLVAVEIECVPAFALHAVETTSTIDEVLDRWVPLAKEHDHFEAYWWPHTDLMSTKANTRLPASAADGHGAARRKGRLAGFVDDELLGNGGGALVAGLGRVAPRLTPTINRLVGTQFANSEYVGPSPEVFCSPRRVRFAEMEYALPLEALPSALRELRALVEREGWKVSFPVELRTAAADDLWLSTAHGRETSYVAVHRYWREDPRTYFDGAEAIFRAHDGRPHWGKLHRRTAADLAPAYPRFADFLAARDRLDPLVDGTRLFANGYTRQVLGD